jgi:anhydro-N-acetylmuramic acid kinase
MAGIFKKVKKRRILVISSGGLKGGLQCLYVSGTNDSWEIIAHAFVPYPQKIEQMLDQSGSGDPFRIQPQDLAWLDLKFSTLYTECARTLLSRVPAALRTPHCAVLNKPSLWRGQSAEGCWDLPLGDAQHLSSSLGIPVIADFIRQNCLSGGLGSLPTGSGNRQIAAVCGGIVIFVNIGLVARMTIVDTGSATVLVDSDTGPGTCCINTIIKRHAPGDDTEGFDRDGALAARGTVDGDCLKLLADDPWFSEPAPKIATADLFARLLDTPQFASLPADNQLSTITALTARTIYDFYRREFKQLSSGQAVYLSGGGSNNLTLTAFLKTFFDTIPVKSVEEIGIPIDMRIPLALGLSVNALVGGLQVSWEPGTALKVPPLGRWVLP